MALPRIRKKDKRRDGTTRHILEYRGDDGRIKTISLDPNHLLNILISDDVQKEIPIPSVKDNIGDFTIDGIELDDFDKQLLKQSQS